MITFVNCFKNTILLFVLIAISCGKTQSETVIQKQASEIVGIKKDSSLPKIITGAQRLYEYLPLLKNKRIGIVANQTSVVSNKNQNFIHLVDTLLQHKIKVNKVFAPEHGFRGTADAGEAIKNGVDTKTGLPIISLYGNNKKPTPAQLQDIDLVIFDIQDVGARFYTYISSLHYVMEACAEKGIPLLVLDRPNPNGHIVDGPILEPEHKSFVGMHPIPVLHGMTIGEYATMINGEKWLNNGVNCELTVIKMAYYNHKVPYSLPIKPSPNLPNDQSINLYASLCFFEGTNLSVGRGTEKQFQIYGAPFLPETSFNFTPKPNEGAKYPKYENEVCYGYDLSEEARLEQLNLSYLLNAYSLTKDKTTFFLKNGFFTKLAGTKKLQQQIEAGKTETEIRTTWNDGLKDFNLKRNKYLLYK
jgi:uncharacterized protein YbbC (DUF1343 family)